MKRLSVRDEKMSSSYSLDNSLFKLCENVVYLFIYLFCSDPPKAKFHYVLLNKEILETLECRMNSAEKEPRCQIRAL